jgi:sphinganine-1-phosphate aldolase
VLRELICKQPLRMLVVTNFASLLIALQLASRHFGGLRGLVVRAYLCAARGTPAARSQLVKMKAQVREKIERMVVKNIGAPTLALPAHGVPDAQISARLHEWSGAESSWRQGRISGTVYSGEDELTRLQAEVFELYAVSNPMHPDVFPSVRKMEAEVVMMVLRLFRAPPLGCGTMTSCGTESILLACKAYRDHARETRGVIDPEMVVPTTAHAAFFKAGHYLGIRVIRVPVDPRSFRADVHAMGRAITRNTVLVGASAPSFAQGVIDPIAPLAALARAAGVGLHVDCCVGSFLIAMMDDLGYDVPPFDFRVEGVSSLSCDTHKYGFAPKGSAVIMYADPVLR